MLPIVALKREGAPPNPNHPLKGQNLAPFQSLQADEALIPLESSATALLQIVGGDKLIIPFC